MMSQQTFSGRPVIIVLGLVVACSLAFTLKSYALDQVSQVLIYAIAILGLNMITGYAGSISLGHGAFFAIGAYTQAILMHRYELSPYAAVPLASAVSAVAGLAFGFPALRLRGLYLALATLAISMSLPPLLKRFEDFTGGHTGIVVDTLSAPAGLGLTPNQWTYFLVLAVAALAFLAGARLLSSGLGRTLIAVRDHELVAQVMGVNPTHYLTLTFAVGSCYAGTAGALYALVVGFVSPDSFSLMLSIGFFVGAVVGGLTSVWGALVGGLFLQYVPTWASDVDKALGGFIYGAILIASMMLMPEGVAGLVNRMTKRFKAAEPDTDKIQPVLTAAAVASRDS